MFAFVLRLVAASPSFEHKTINLRIFKESSHHIYQKLMPIAKSHWKVLCLLSIKLTKKNSAFFTTTVHTNWWGSFSFSHAEEFELLHHSASAVVYVQIINVTLRHFIEVSVLSQKRVNDHVCPCCAYRFCLHFDVFLIAFWNCPDDVALNWFSYVWGKFQLELYFIICGKLTISCLTASLHGLLSVYLWFDLN